MDVIIGIAAAPLCWLLVLGLTLYAAWPHLRRRAARPDRAAQPQAPVAKDTATGEAPPTPGTLESPPSRSRAG